VRKCHYCGFFSTHYDQLLAESYLDALEREVDLYADLLRTRSVSTLYVGGGTPTALPPGQLHRLFALLEEHLTMPRDAEITVEANPAAAAPDVLAVLRQWGVTRLSIGVQSFDDIILAALGRVHTAAQAVQAFRQARDAGFENIGIDLIYGVPRQQAHQWRATLDQTLSLAPEHCSAYCLSADTGSRLWGQVRSGAAALPDESTALGMYRTAVRAFEDSGYRHYELSNFALAGRECRHNRNYWSRGEYLGLGPGASSFLGERRWMNMPDVEGYSSRLLQGGTVEVGGETLTEDQAAMEALLLGLRMAEGVDLGRYGERYGSDRRDLLLRRAQELEPHRLLTIVNDRLRLTARGMALAEEVLVRLAA
jgi:oxygen-independent coproporphyrinogen-3 oxidase